MLIKVNSLTFKTKINVKIKPKTKYLNPEYFSYIKEKETIKLLKKQVQITDCHQNLNPP